ncbi:hypothetical protein VSR01_16395 [Actinacidiphila sp. DG2A-62]|nr:hypothetical protein [Actinacidiphila sp. DG2A-62]MEC3995026.1 hypothetical protein [Actinacidiphila sp. DG2A-62]
MTAVPAAPGLDDIDALLDAATAQLPRSTWPRSSPPNARPPAPRSRPRT